MLADPTYAARIAAQAAGGDDEFGGGDVHDDDVLDELAELEGQVHAERGSGGGGRGGSGGAGAAARHRGGGSHGDIEGELDEDAMLAEAEEEANRMAEEEERAATAAAKPVAPPRPQQTGKPPQPQLLQPPQQQPQAAQPVPPRTTEQQVTSSSAALVAPPSPAPTAASELVALQAQLLDLKKKAVAFKQAGQQAQAIEVMRNVKTVQARVEEMQKAIAATPAATATTSANVTAAAPPQPAHPAASRPSVPARPPIASTPVAAAATVPPVPSVSSGVPKLSVRATLEYDDLLSKLDAQIASLNASMKTVVAEGSGATVAANSKQAKLLALQYFRAKTRSTKDRDIVLLARSRGLAPPQTHVEELPVQSELSFLSLGEDEVRVEVIQARELRNSAVLSDPRDTQAYVTAHIEYATDMDGNYRAQAPVHTHTAKGKGSEPQFHQTLVLPFPCSRSSVALQRDKTVLKRLMRSKVVLVVWHKRFLLGGIEIGRTDVKLKEMALKAELKLTLKLKDEKQNNGLGARTGELDVVLRLRKPFEGIDLRTNKLPLIVVDEFEEPTEVTQPPAAAAASAAAAAAAMSVSATAATPATAAPAVAPVHAAAAAAALTAAASSAATAVAPVAATSSSSGGIDLSDPHDVVKMRSNDVLEAEIVLLQAELAVAQAKGGAEGAEEADAAQDRLTAAQVQLQVLVTQVQNGKLTLEEYLAGLRTAILSEGALALALHKAGRKADALRVMQRVKIMKAEVKNAEENQEELEQC
jgi:hypothetical protein